MRAGIFRDALLVVAPCAAVLAGLSSVDHRQRLVEAGYRVAGLERERDELAREVEHRRARVANLSSPARLLVEVRARQIPVDYPIRWNVVAGAAEAAALVAPKAAPSRGAARAKAPSTARGASEASRPRSLPKPSAPAAARRPAARHPVPVGTPQERFQRMFRESEPGFAVNGGTR
jgi:hypothetical protein